METITPMMLPAALQSLGRSVIRYSLVLLIGWIGAMKFTEYEALAIQPLVASSPLTSWLYNLLAIRPVSTLLGCIELTIAALIAARPVSPIRAAVGSAMAVPMFFTTFSFLFSLPGWEPELGGFPALSSAGGFLVKDMLLLGAALWSLGEALQAANEKNAESVDSNARRAAPLGADHG